MKLYVVVPASLMPLLRGWSVRVCCESWRGEGNSTISPEALRFLVDLGSGSCSTFFDFTIGNDNPRSFPLLATPTFHVKAVL